MTPWTIRVRLAALGVAIVVFAFLVVFPMRSWFAQRNEVNRMAQEVSVLQTQNRKLQTEENLLQTPSEIERLARERFNMVKPGEIAYSVIPMPPTTATTTAAPSQP
jgi:cell division protein FtsL